MAELVHVQSLEKQMKQMDSANKVLKRKIERQDQSILEGKRNNLIIREQVKQERKRAETAELESAELKKQLLQLQIQLQQEQTKYETLEIEYHQLQHKMANVLQHQSEMPLLIGSADSTASGSESLVDVMEPGSLQSRSSAADPLEKRAIVPASSVPVTLQAIFQRRTFGGVLMTNDQVYYLSESKVQQYELQHQAQVQIQVIPEERRVLSASIKVQGDDKDSSIVQLVGILEQRESGWHCVSLTSPVQQFPLHARDAEIQQPYDQQPCVFNIDSQGPNQQFARLSRLFDTCPVEQAKTPSKRQPDKTKKKQPVSQFLPGMTVAVIGGERKWFESVVVEAGATFIHDEDQHISRVSAQLQHANVICVLTTSVSRHSSSAAMDIAKAQQIPLLIIEGSKSNLRMQLWDNQKIIRQTHAN